MVGKIISLINREIPGVHQAAFLLGFFAVLSQILALVRDRMFAHNFGADRALDLYYAAFRIPDFIFVSLGSVVSMSVLIPFLINRIEKGEGEARLFINTVFTYFVVAMLVVAGCVFFLMPVLVPAIFQGFSSSELEVLVTMSRIMLISPFLLGISNLFGTLTQVHNRFVVYALSPILYNAGIILGILFLYPVHGLYGLAYGVGFGALLHLAIQVPFVYKSGLFPQFVYRPSFSLIKTVASTSLPRTFALSANHVALFALVVIATFLPAGSIAVFNFSFNLQSVPLTIVGVSYSLAAFPTLSRLFSLQKTKEFFERIVTSARHIIFWIVPFAVMFIVLRAHIIRVILGSGSFDWDDTRLTAATLALFSVSLVFQALTLLFVRGFYAMGDTRRPFIFSVIGATSVIAMSILLLKVFEAGGIFRFFIEDLFKVNDILGTEILMLAFGFTIGSIFHALLLTFSMRSRFTPLVTLLLPTFFQIFSASVIMGFSTVLFLRLFDDLFALERFWGIFGHAFISGVLGILLGILTLKLLGNREIKEIWTTLQNRFWKASVVGPDVDITQ